MDGDICDCPEDWPADPPGLRLLDRSLRCGICQDIYTGPVVLVCGHSYCSRCIRDSLNVRLKDGQAQACPSCRVPCDQADLRPATHLREASQAWQAVRQLLLKHHICMLQQPQAQAHVQQQQRQQQQQQQLQQQDTSHNHATVQATQQQQEQQQVRSSLRHVLGPELRCQRRAVTDARAAVRLQQQADAITISSNAEADSDGEGGCSVTSDAEIATVEDAGDPDWQDSDGSDDCQQHRSSRQKRQPCAAAGKRKLHSGHSSSSAGDVGALSCSQPDEEAASGDEFEVRECKRPRSAASDKHQQRQHLQDLSQPGVAVQIMQAADKHVQQRQSLELEQSSVKQQQQRQLLPGYVACPVCGLSVKQAFINTHVDSCLTRSGNTQLPAVAATASKKHTTVALSTAATAADKTASRRSSHLMTSGASAGSGHGGTAARRARNRMPLEPPPKLCFELMKDKVLKAKLASLGLSNEGDKKACVDRYTSFRSYILALKDDGKAGVSLAQAAADFTRQEKHKARVASRPQSLGALAAAVPSLSGGLQSNGAKQSTASGAVAGHVMGVTNPSTVMDHSYAALIQETRARMALQKRQPGLQQDGTLQQAQDHCQQQGQPGDSMAIREMGVLHSVQPEQRPNSNYVTEDDVQLASAAVIGVGRQATGSQGARVAPIAKQAAAAVQRNLAMAATMQQYPSIPESEDAVV